MATRTHEMRWYGWYTIVSTDHTVIIQFKVPHPSFLVILKDFLHPKPSKQPSTAITQTFQRQAEGQWTCIAECMAIYKKRTLGVARDEQKILRDELYHGNTLDKEDHNGRSVPRMYTGLQRGKEMKTSSCRQLSTQPVGSTRVTECPSYASLSVPWGFSPWSRTEDPQQKHCFLCVKNVSV